MNPSKIARRLILAGGLITLANGGTCTYNNAINVDGDGYSPENGLISLALGTRRGAECYKTPVGNWNCEPAVASRGIEEAVAGADGQVLQERRYDTESILSQVATHIGPGVEFLLGLGILGAGLYIKDKKKQ